MVTEQKGADLSHSGPTQTEEVWVTLGVKRVPRCPAHVGRNVMAKTNRVGRREVYRVERTGLA